MTREDRLRSPWASGVTHSELIEDVGVGGREIRHRVLAEQETLEHRLVNDAPGLLFVSTDRDHPGVLDRRRDRSSVDPIEVDLRSPCRIRLEPEGHEDEAEGGASHLRFIIQQATRSPPA